MEVFEELLVDDGLKHRGHRKTIFSKDLLYVGIGVAYHSKHGCVVVFDYVKDILKEGQMPTI